MWDRYFFRRQMAKVGKWLTILLVLIFVVYVMLASSYGN